MVKKYEKESEYLRTQLKKHGITLVPPQGIDSVFVPKIDYVICINRITHSDVRIENRKFIGYPRLVVSVRKSRQNTEGRLNDHPRYFQASARCDIVSLENVHSSASYAAIDNLMGNPEFRKALEN